MRFRQILVASHALRVFLAVLACVSLLQMPVPIAHSHEAFHDEVGLADHLFRHHPLGHFDHDEYHWHFWLPCEFGQQGDSSQPDECPKRLFCGLTNSTEASLLTDSQGLDTLPCDCLPQESVGSNSRSIFGPQSTCGLSHPPPAACVQVLLCVMLC
ncbi:MAG: hypothetical protein NXI32_19325 [bacterium]|nr:hypothetical protein [bacterium]